jgi:hypothetical protein
MPAAAAWPGSTRQAIELAMEIISYVEPATRFHAPLVNVTKT